KLLNNKTSRAGEPARQRKVSREKARLSSNGSIKGVPCSLTCRQNWARARSSPWRMPRARAAIQGLRGLACRSRSFLMQDVLLPLTSGIDYMRVDGSHNRQKQATD